MLAFLAAVIGDNIGFAVGYSGGRLVERFGRYIPGTVLFTLRAALSETPCQRDEQAPSADSVRGKRKCGRMPSALLQTRTVASASMRSSQTAASTVEEPRWSQGQRRRFWCEAAAART